MIGQKFKPLERFFLFAAGTDLQLLANCGGSEKNKQVNIGAAVIFTALFAFAAMYFAISFVSSAPIISIVVAILWSGFIFTLDRFIVSSVRKSESLKRDLINYSPRIVLAILISFTLSVPLEMKLFESEISVAREKVADEETIAYQNRIDSLTREIKTQERKRTMLDTRSVDSTAIIQDETRLFRDQISSNENKIAQLRRDIQVYETRANAKRDDARALGRRVDELRGKQNLTPDEARELQTKPGRVAAANAEANRISAQANPLRNELSQLTNQNTGLQDSVTTIRKFGIDQIREETNNAKNIIAENRIKIEAQTKEREIKKKAFTGFLANLKSLHAIEGIGFALWFIRFLFMVLELAPIMNKVLSTKDAYDRLLDDVDKRIATNPYGNYLNGDFERVKDQDIEKELKEYKVNLVKSAFESLKADMNTKDKAETILKLYQSKGIDFDFQEFNKPESIVAVTDKSWYYENSSTDFIRFNKNGVFIRKIKEQTFTGTWNLAPNDKNTLVIKLPTRTISMDVLEVNRDELLLWDRGSETEHIFYKAKV